MFLEAVRLPAGLDDFRHDRVVGIRFENKHFVAELGHGASDVQEDFGRPATGVDRGEESRKDAAAVILFTAEKATQMALDAIQLLGGNGYINDFPTGRLLRDAKLYEIGAGTSEVRRMLIGRELFNDTK